ncbi:FkbM family methyltransferase [Aerosakkonemataceae cyanobacterium BLCC-F50]|uniref:FkbM family methyltransferase n=1 Tax=Floridaenema flaviceps BLCC-F50 TaxID=3153642 RepID=A0ABV4Y351_9CYAN
MKNKNIVSELLKNDLIRANIINLVQITNRGRGWVDRNCPESYQTIVKYFKSAKLNIDTSYYIEKLIFLYGYFDPEVIWFIKKYLPKSATILDIGANIGTFSIGVATHLNKNGRVYAFEPGDKVFQRFRANLEINPQLHEIILLSNYGIGEKQSTYFRREVLPDGNGSLIDEEGKPYNSGEIVNIISLDEWVNLMNIKSIDFIKIDVEGFEYLVFTGAREVINYYQPMLWFESTNVRSGSVDAMMKCYDFLQELGYVIINPAKIYTSIPQYGIYPQESLAVHKSKTDFLNAFVTP